MVFYPRWLGCLPALLKSLLEQVLRPGFALPASKAKSSPRTALVGKSARIVVVMGMPVWLRRIYALVSKAA